MSRYTFLTAASAVAVLCAAALAPARASAQSYGISITTGTGSNFADPGCGVNGSYSTAQGKFGFNQSTGATGCSNSYASPTRAGLTKAKVSAGSLDDGNTDLNTTSVDLATASLHAYASATGTSGFFSGGVAGNTNVPSQFWDTLSFTVAGATSSAVTNIPFTFSVDGSLTAGPNNPEMTAEAAVQLLPGAGCGGGVGCIGGAGAASWNSSWGGYNPDGSPILSNSDSLSNFDNVSYTLVTDTTGDFAVDGVLSLTGAGAVEYVGALLGVKSAGGVVDFSDTAQLSFNLPAGVTFTSASGVFPTGPSSAVPEPSIWAMLLLGLGGVGAAMRGRGENGEIAAKPHPL